MPEWLIGALCSAPIWIVLGMLLTLKEFIKQFRYFEEGNSNDNDER